MPNKSQSDLFIRLLAEALEADRLIRKTSLSERAKASAGRFTQLFQSDLDHAVHSLEPLHSLQCPEASRSQEQRLG